MNGKFENTHYVVPYCPMMSENEQQLFRDALKNASVYFEYGIGGSSIWAMAYGLDLNGVETDKHWMLQVTNCLDPYPYDLRYIDIGPVGYYGKPSTISDNFEIYSKSILIFEKNFDLVLIDGRFRVACAATVAEMAIESQNRNLKVYFHDFFDRHEYSIVTKFMHVESRADDAAILSVNCDADIEFVREVWEHNKHNFW